MSLFTEEIKNSRFWIAQEIVALMGFALIAMVGLVAFTAYKGFTLDTALVAIVSSITGAIVAQGATVVNGYFKDQAAQDAAAAEIASMQVPQPLPKQ